jgi:hypothetical protein
MPAFVHNTNALDLIGLKSHVDDTFINDAIVVFTVKDKAGVEVAGETWPQTMTYVEGSDGDYRGILTAALELVAKQHYTAIIEADGGGERIGHFEVPFRPVVRTGLPEGVTSA